MAIFEVVKCPECGWGMSNVPGASCRNADCPSNASLHIRGCQALQGIGLPCNCNAPGRVGDIAGDAPCAQCGRDNRNGTHRALEMTGHLSHEYVPEVGNGASQVYGGVQPVRNDWMTNQLRTYLQAFATITEQVNRDNGWYEEERSVGDDTALLHSEVSEMFEAYRDHGFEDVTTVTHNGLCAMFQHVEPGCEQPVCNCGAVPEPKGFGSECADVLIRLLDTCTRRGVDLAGETRRKLDYNKTRGYHHGGKRL